MRETPWLVRLSLLASFKGAIRKWCLLAILSLVLPISATPATTRITRIVVCGIAFGRAIHGLGNVVRLAFVNVPNGGGVIVGKNAAPIINTHQIVRIGGMLVDAQCMSELVTCRCAHFVVAHRRALLIACSEQDHDRLEERLFALQYQFVVENLFRCITADIVGE